MPSDVIRVLHIARYRSPAMERKLEQMAAQSEGAFWLLRPAFWQDEYGRVAVDPRVPGCQVIRVLMIGRTSDPHRALYRTWTFGLPAIRPDIIHAEEEPDSLAALQIVLARRLFAPQARLILHTWQNINRPKRWYVWLVARISLGSADAILCANRGAVDVLRAMGYGGATAVIPPIGVDTRVFQPAGPRPDSAPFRVAYAGRFVPEKGLETLLEAVAQLGPEAELWLIGDGPHRPVLEALGIQLGLGERIHWVPPQPSERMPEVLAQVDVVVLPSRTTSVWKEQFGRILVEAMACKVPVVGSDSGAIPEIVGDAGLIFSEGDGAALAENLRRLRASPDLRRELAERGYRRGTSLYSQERIAEQTIQAYQGIISDRFPSRPASRGTR